jgi:predicted permease
MPGIAALGLDGRVLGFLTLITLTAGVLVGIVPAIRQSRGDLRGLISDGGRGTTAVRGGRLRTGLVIVEIALAVVLLVSSVLLVKAFVLLRSAELGFDIEDRVTLGIALPATRYPEADAVHAFQRTLLERLEGVPGARAVGATSILPMDGSSGRYYTVPDEPAPEAGREPVAEVRYVSPGYFQALGISIEAGRVFTAGDNVDAPRVAIVTPALAARHWPDDNAVGRRIRFGGEDHEIVGVVASTLDGGPDDEPERMAYLPLLQNTVRTFDIAVHTPLDVAPTADAVRRVVGDLDPRQPIHDLSTLQSNLEDELAGSLAMTKVLGVLAAIAFLLSGVGVYGVMAYSVAQRRHEVGIRMALGAGTRDVLALILRRGVFMTGFGVALGVLLSLGVTRLLSFFLFGVSPFDPLAFLSVPAALALTGLIASLLPALRAAGVDPLVSLRTD